MSKTSTLSASDIIIATRIHTQLLNFTLPDTSQFWRDIESIDIPLTKEISSENEYCEVIFLWRSTKSLDGVYVRLNRVTDKSNVSKGLMNNIPSSDIWFITLLLPRTYRGSYSFIEIPQGTSPETISQLGSRYSAFIGQPDPLNKTPEINVRGTIQESILSLDRAPEQSEWISTLRTFPKEVDISYPVIAGHKRRVRLYLPKGALPVPMGLLVLLDAEIWLDHIRLLGAIEIATNNGRIAPLAILGIDNLSESDRFAILGGHSEIILDISNRLIPQLQSDYPNIIWAGCSNTILAGQSLGGVTALMATLYAPNIFGSVICHSPSMWWSPDQNRRPFMLNENDTSWVSEQVLRNPPKDIKIQFCVGSLEGLTVPFVQQLHQQLLNAGVDSNLSIYTGGHDYAWWRGALIDELVKIYKANYQEPFSDPSL